MKITLLTIGSQGDLQPFIALALGLQKAGHEITLATHTNFENLVTTHGIQFAPIRIDSYQLINSIAQRGLISSNSFRAIQNLAITLNSILRQILDDSWKAAQEAEALIYHPLLLCELHIAEALHIPCIIASTVPFVSHDTS